MAKIFCWKRCSPRFLRKTRETLQKEHQDKLTKQQQQEAEKKRLEEELSKERKEEARYDKDPTLIVRPGKKSKVPKVSVAIDATPAARTESILNQMPIELAKGVEPGVDPFNKSIDYPMIDPSQLQPAPQVVVIEHHHSKSDPLPMENVLKSVKPNFSTPRIYESDSGSTSSLYAKINPKLKSRLPRPELNRDGSAMDQTEDIYMKMGPKLTTFAVNCPPPPPAADTCGDINVTCREPSPEERECVSPEEALRTIKRRNYPKVLPDIEKRRSLPAPSSLFSSKQGAGSLKDYRSGFHSSSSSSSHQPPQPPPRTFGPSKSLEFAEESENQSETETIVTNLHVGSLLRRQDYSAKNNSDPSIIDSLDERMDNRSSRVQSGGGSVDTIYSSNAMCHPGHEIGQPIFQSVGKDIGNPIALLQAGIGNPNWYKSTPTGNDICIGTASSEPRITIREVERQPQFGGSNWDTRIPGSEPRIVITPRVGNLLGQNQSLNRTVVNLSGTTSDERLENREIKSSAPHESSRSNSSSIEQLESDCPLTSCSSPDSGLPSGQPGQEPRKEPRIIITARDPKASSSSSSSLKQPKIIIKPTSSLQRSRDHRNIPKVSAIPPPEQSCQSTERDKPSGEQREKPPLKEKPKITRIPSFSRRVEEPSGGTERGAVPSYPEKAEIVHRVEAVASGKVVNVTVACDGKSSIPTLQRKEGEKCSSVESGTGPLNTATIKKKPASKK